jgi:hypothetical protein
MTDLVFWIAGLAPLFSLGTPLPATPALHFLDQVKLEKNRLANGTRPHPHGFSPDSSNVPEGGVLALFAEFPLTFPRTNCSLVALDIFHSSTKFS